jgi:hypothetical protein
MQRGHFQMAHLGAFFLLILVDKTRREKHANQHPAQSNLKFGLQILLQLFFLSPDLWLPS